MAAANGRERAGFGTGEGDHLFHDAQNQFGARGDGEFFEKAVQMRVDSVIRDIEPPGNPCLGRLSKTPLNNLQFALREAQGAGNLKPSMFAEGVMLPAVCGVNLAGFSRMAQLAIGLDSCWQFASLSVTGNLKTKRRGLNAP